MCGQRRKFKNLEVRPGEHVQHVANRMELVQGLVVVNSWDKRHETGLVPFTLMEKCLSAKVESK